MIVQTSARQHALALSVAFSQFDSLVSAALEMQQAKTHAAFCVMNGCLINPRKSVVIEMSLTWQCRMPHQRRGLA